MTVRPETRALQIALEMKAQSMARTRRPGAVVHREGGVILVKHKDRAGCIYIRPSERHIPKSARLLHSAIRKDGLRVFVCQSEVDIGFALDALPKIKVRVA